MNKKYNTFEELYDDYKDIIDTEFALQNPFQESHGFSRGMN